MSSELKLAPVLSISATDAPPGCFAALASGLQALSESERVSVFAPGAFLEKWFRSRPQDPIWIRDRIKAGSVEFLGGTYDDVMFPFFPHRLVAIQLKKHRDLLERHFAAGPSGFFNNSMTWEIGMTAPLSRAGFEYTLVEDTAVAGALGRITRVSGWFSTENNGRLMRLLAIDTRLSRAAEDFDAWNFELENLPQNGKTWVVRLPVKVESEEGVKAFFERFYELLSCGAQTWTTSHTVETQHSEGSVTLLSAVGGHIGLPASAVSCRELLLKRPEVHFLHKSLLFVFNHVEKLLNEREFREVAEIFMPIMAPKYYVDLGSGQGIRSPELRFKAHSEILRAAEKVASYFDSGALRAEVTDYLLAGEQQIFVENSKMSFLLEPGRGAVLRSLNFKPALVNFLTAFRDDGDVSVAFADHILPPAVTSAVSLDGILQDRSRALLAPYDFQLERSPGLLHVQLTGEQVVQVEEKPFIFHVEKAFSVGASADELTVSYKVMNMMFQEYSGYFGTELELGSRALDAKGVSLKIDGLAAKIPHGEPAIFADIKEFDLHDAAFKVGAKFTFESEVSCMVAPIFGSDTLASPSVLQGTRLLFFRHLELPAAGSVEFSIKVALRGRRF